MTSTRRTVTLVLDGMLAVHAVRAVHTALGGVPGVQTAQVHLGRAELDVEGPVDAGALEAAIGAALAPVGITVRACTVHATRTLPQV